MKQIFLVCVFGLNSFSTLTAQNAHYKYDAAGRVTVITYPNAKAVNYSYDKDGNRTYHATTIDSTLLPHAGVISGSLNVCVGSTIALSDTASGGIWSASNPSASVTGAGIVTGVSVGSVVISYSVTNSFGTAYATYPINVLSTAACSTLGTGTLSSSSDLIIVYPNPTDATFTIEIPGANGVAMISIQDISGQVIETKTVNVTLGLKEAFNLEKMARGTYFIKACSNDKTYEKKIVIW